jgi:hypothetical protein
MHGMHRPAESACMITGLLAAAHAPHVATAAQASPVAVQRDAASMFGPGQDSPVRQ